MYNMRKRIDQMERHVFGDPDDDIDVTTLTDGELDRIIRLSDGPHLDVSGYTDAQLEAIVRGESGQ